MLPTGRVPPFQPSSAQYNFPELELFPSNPLPEIPSPSSSLRIRLPPAMAPFGRSSTRRQTASLASGSEYHDSNNSVDEDENAKEVPEDEEEEPKVKVTLSARGRPVAKVSYAESTSEDELTLGSKRVRIRNERGGAQQNGAEEEEDEEDDDQMPRYGLRNRRRTKMNGFIVSDDDGDGDGDGDGGSRYVTRSKGKGHSAPSSRNGRSGTGNRRILRRSGSNASASLPKPSTRSTRRTRSARDDENDDVYVDQASSPSMDNGSLDEAPRTSSEPEPEPEDADAEGDIEVGGDGEQDVEQDGRPYSLRQRQKINYAIPPPLEEMKPPPRANRPSGGRANGRSGGGFGNGRSKPPGWSASGAELERWMGGGNADDSVCHYVSSLL